MGHVRVARTARCAAPWRRQRAPRPSTAAAASSSTAAAALSVADLLVQQRDRDLQGHGVSLRPVAEEGWQAEYTSRYSSTKLSRSCTQLLISFDRLLSDERRCAAYVAAIDSALASGARTFAVLGAGSLLPALHAARAGAKVAIIEPCEPLAGVARAAASSNGVTIAVLAKAELLRRAWGGPPDAIISERVDEGLLAEGIVGSLRSAVRAFGGAPRHVLPRAASVCAVAVQLGFDGVDGFGLDGLGIDLRQFDSLRPSGAMALQHPGYWPVRLVPARQPHRRLSRPFAATRVQFDEVCANACSSGGAGGAYGGMAGAAAGSGATLSVSVVESGLLNAIVYWFDLEVGEGADARVSSAPPESGNRHGAAGGWSEGWRQAAGYLTTPRYVTAGETLTIAAHVDLESGLRFELLAVTPKATPKADGAFGGTSPYEDGHGAAARAVSMVVGGLVSGLVDGGKLNRGASLPITAYHFCMVADTVRNDAYRAAIERAVRRRPGCRVLDIGAGTGLLGLIASRAGASAVDCVEMNDVLARVASGTLQASGVTAANVWHTISTDLPLDPTGKAGPTGRADVIVSEVLDSGLLGACRLLPQPTRGGSGKRGTERPWQHTRSAASARVAWREGSSFGTRPRAAHEPRGQMASDLRARISSYADRPQERACYTRCGMRHAGCSPPEAAWCLEQRASA